MNENDTTKESGNEVKPKFRVAIGKPVLLPTLKLTAPKGGWNPAIHQTTKKAVGRTKD